MKLSCPLWRTLGTGLAILIAAESSFAASAISVSVGARGANIGPLAASDVAGVVPISNWNDVSTSTGFEASLPTLAAGTVRDSSGAIVPDLAVTFGGTLAIQIGFNYGPDGVHDGDLKLMSGFARGAFDADKGLSLNVTNIPYAAYDLYVYADTFGSLITQYDVNGTTYYGIDSSPGNFIGANFAYSQFTTTSLAAAQAEAAAPTAQHNYVKFLGLTNPNLSLTAFQSNNGGGGEEGIQAFQIVNAVPEPTSFSLAALGALAVIRRRWRS